MKWGRHRPYFHSLRTHESDTGEMVNRLVFE